MANRHLSRSVVFQTLFALDVQEGGIFLAARERATEALISNAKEFASDAMDLPFMKELLAGILSKNTELEQVIVKAAPEWPLERIAATDRNVLRIGLYELLFSGEDAVPPKVAINEAIELAKTFGSDTSAKFVNGVLGAVYKDIGEPRKDETGKHEAGASAAEAPEEVLAGAIVFARKDGMAYCALVHDVFGKWTFSKGHVQTGEASKDAVLRVVKDEIGLTGTVVAFLGENAYTASDPDKGKVAKRVAYYLVEAPYTDLVLKASGGLDGAQWFPLSDVPHLHSYADIAAIVAKGIEYISHTLTNHDSV